MPESMSPGLDHEPKPGPTNSDVMRKELEAIAEIVIGPDSDSAENAKRAYKNKNGSTVVIERTTGFIDVFVPPSKPPKDELGIGGSHDSINAVVKFTSEGNKGEYSIEKGASHLMDLDQASDSEIESIVEAIQPAAEASEEQLAA